MSEHRTKLNAFNPSSHNGTHYQLSGSSAHDTIVLIHGLGLNRQIWQRYESELARHYQVLSYDFFGHGESAPAPWQPDLTLYARQLVELMDALNIDKASLIGFSLGGMINRRVAMDYKDRVSSLVILNSPHERTVEAQLLAEKQALDSAKGGPLATLDAAIKRWFTEDFRQSNPSFVHQVCKWLLSNNKIQYAQCRDVLATGVIELINPQPPITHPTLIMTCENDSGSTPAMSTTIASEIVDAETIIVPHLQHMGLTERPDLFIGPIKRFLQKTHHQGERQ